MRCPGHFSSFTLVSVLCLVAQSCLTLCDPMHCSLPGYSVHGIFQARTLEWAAISSSRVSSLLRDQTRIFCIASRFFTKCQFFFFSYLNLLDAPNLEFKLLSRIVFIDLFYKYFCLLYADTIQALFQATFLLSQQFSQHLGDLRTLAPFQTPFQMQSIWGQSLESLLFCSRVFSTFFTSKKTQHLHNIPVQCMGCRCFCLNPYHPTLIIPNQNFKS